VGCDIHGFWEVRLPSGKWLAIKEINDGRSYTWFGLVAGVRSRIPYTVVAPRGFPKDASDAWLAYSDGDFESGFFHNPTWLTPSEVATANAAFCKEREDWLEAEKMTPEQVASDHERIPQLTDEVEELIIGYTYVVGEGNKSRIKWSGTIKDLVGEDAVYENAIRMVIAFDN